MANFSTSRSRLVSPILREIAWGKKYGAFDDPVGRSLLRALYYGAADEQIHGMIQQRVRRLRARDVFGRLEPFAEPRLPEAGLLIGTSRAGKDLRISQQALTAGTIIAARTGGGKSNFLRFFTPQVARSGVRVWITDQWKREARQLRPFFQKVGADLVVLRPRDMKYDPLHPGTSDPRHHLPNVVNVLSRRLGLGTRARTIVLQASHALYAKFGVWDGRTDAYPCLFDLWECIKKGRDLNAPARDAILDRLGAVLGELKPYRLGWSPRDLARHNICFELSGASEPVKHVLMEPLIYSVFQAEIDRGLVNASLGLFVVFEDAQAYTQDVGGEMTPLDVGAGLFRSTGLGLCVNVQTMRGLSRKLVPNLAGLKIMGPMGCSQDYTRLGSDMGLGREQIEWAKRGARPGTFIAKTDAWPEPFLLQVPHVPLLRPVPDEEAEESVNVLDHLKTVAADEYSDWKPNYIIKVMPEEEDQRDPREKASRNGRDSRQSLPKEELDYLESVARSPFLGATQRDDHLSLSSWKGNKIRGKLIKKALVRAVAINPGGRGKRFQILELTERGEQLLRSYDIQLSNGRGRGGIVHQWWTWRISEWLRTKGVTTSIEDESLGARVDIAAETKEGTIAVEVETSHGHEMNNIQKDLEAGFSKVVSLLGDADQADKLRAKFGKELTMTTPEVHVGRLTEYAEILEDLV